MTPGCTSPTIRVGVNAEEARARGDDLWDVLLESVRDDEMNCLRGRIHFVSGNTHRLSGWIFLEWAERDVETRFGEFSAQELWSLLDSLG